MLFSVLVVGRAALLQHRGERGGGERLGRGDVEQGLGQREHVAAVAVGHRDHRRARLWRQRQLALLEGLGLGQQALQRLVVEPLQHVDLAARQQRAVQLERGVLGGRADQRHRSRLHERQEAVLLGAVEAVDLVDEEQRRLASEAASARGLERLLQVRDAREHRRQLLELVACLLGQQPRDRGLARPGRTPEDHRGQPVRVGHAADRAVRPQQVVLPHHLVEALRAQPIGQRPRRLRLQPRGLEKIRHGARVSKNEAGNT